MLYRSLYYVTEGVVLDIVEGASELKAEDLVSRSGAVTSKNVGCLFSIKKKKKKKQTTLVDLTGYL